MTTATQNSAQTEAPDMKLFWGCFVALIATAFGFILRALIIDDWGTEFSLSETQKGEILGVGLWPFAISIVLFSLIIDSIGYRNAMIFAFVCHIISALVTIFATGYWMLYAGTFIVAIGNGTVEAAINPVVATMFSKDKTKWLNMLHAGWPGGLVLGGLLAISLGSGTAWQYKIALILIPTVVYGVMLFKREFPINERVKAGVSYLDMLKQVGVAGALVITSLMVFQLGSVFDWSNPVSILLTVGLVGVFGLYVKSFGKPLFFVLLLIMIPLAITELGTDSWITDLVTPEMTKLGIQAGWVLVYTSAIMAVLRLSAGSIVHSISPLGVLALGSAIAALGLYLLAQGVGAWILIAATVYGIGKAFFWPTILGLVAEQFPKGGALTLNIIAGVGMIGAGVIGTVVLGNVQDQSIERGVLAYDQANSTRYHSEYVTEAKRGLFGKYNALNPEALASAEATVKGIFSEIQAQAKKGALKTVAFFPIIMFVSFVVLILYFSSRGGYRAVDIETPESSPEELKV